MAVSKKNPGLYANIQAKHERIAHGSGEKMRKAGEEGAPTSGAFKEAEKTTKAGNSKNPSGIKGKKS